MSNFLFGMNTMGFLVATVFFLRFWQKTRDTLFIAFSAAFLLFAINQFFLALQNNPDAPHSWPFYFNLAGFGLLLFAILRKNLK
jgi:Family of unknown function (DUF5985)